MVNKKPYCLKNKYVKLRNDERKIKLPFMIYADFESILVPKNDENQYPEESYTKKILKTNCLQSWL